MKIAVVGAGFAGLSVSYHLQASGSCSVTLFDAYALCGGASKIASGLVHPYVGEQVRRSLLASEAMDAVKDMLCIAEKFSEKPIADSSGIIRKTASKAQKEQMLAHARDQQDVVFLGEDQFLITSGITVHSEMYLAALSKACQSLGAEIKHEKVEDLSSLFSFDAIVIAAGAGSMQFKELENKGFGKTRGQLLVSRWPSDMKPLARSLVGKGYIAKSIDESDPLVTIGSTYERGRCDDAVDSDFAKEQIAPKASDLVPGLFLDPTMVKAGVRLTCRGHYLPAVGRLQERLWVMTGFGSRGLLYHALMGKLLASAILHDDPEQLPQQLKQQFHHIMHTAYTEDVKSPHEVIR